MTDSVGVLAPAFRDTADGPTLDLGTYRFVRPWIVGVAIMSGAAVVFYLWLGSFLASLRPVTPLIWLGFASPVLVFLALAVGLGAAVAVHAGTWSLTLSESGLRVARGGRVREIPWARIARVRYGPVAVRVSRYQTELAEGLWIDVRGRGSQRFDTARFRVRAADLDAMAAAVRETAARRGTLVEPFPMIGRDRF